MFPPCTVNHKMPCPSNTAVCGSSAFSTGILYSVTLPVRGSSFPIYPPEIAVNQMLPSLSATSPCGPEFGVFSGYSLNSPVFGSSQAQLVRRLPCVPERPVRRECRIVRPGLRRRHRVFLDIYVQRLHRREPCKRGGQSE